MERQHDRDCDTWGLDDRRARTGSQTSVKDTAGLATTVRLFHTHVMRGGLDGFLFLASLRRIKCHRAHFQWRFTRVSSDTTLGEVGLDGWRCPRTPGQGARGMATRRGEPKRRDDVIHPSHTHAHAFVFETEYFHGHLIRKTDAVRGDGVFYCTQAAEVKCGPRTACTATRSRM